MAHDHHHTHGAGDVGDGVLLWTIVINLGLSVFEFAAGLVSGSVALMADALHNTNDAAALLIAYIARKISRKGVDRKFTFGYRRAELIGAMIQLTALILVGLYLLYEAVHRLFNPQPILGGWIMAAAAVALVVDLATAWLLWAMSRGSLNVKAAFLHNLTDAGSSLAVLVAGAVIYWRGWTWIDPLLTLGLAGYILVMSFGLLRRTSGILMEGVPPGLSVDHLQDSVKAIDGVADLHHLHVWELDEHHRALEAHIVIDPVIDQSPSARQQLRQRIKDNLEREFSIPHSTLELETVEQPCDDRNRACGG
jgi:cobalt-zinc-cadmium efflux system protein